MAGTWMLEVLGSGVLSATLLAGAGWLFKQQISAWLNRDLERIKAQHQRELEAYKVSLIAEAEKSKAESELKKAGALRIVEKRFNAIDRLHSASLSNAVDFLAVATCEAGLKTIEQYNELTSRFEELGGAIHAAEVFLTQQQRQQLLHYRGTILEIKHFSIIATPKLEGAALEELRTKSLAAEIVVDDLLRGEIEKMMGMH